MSESALIQDLAVLMTAAGLIALVFGKLRWPKVIGYIFAGILLSKNTWGGSFLTEGSSVPVIGQLGIIFLMLTLGLDFSPGALKKVRGVSVPMAIADSAVMIWIGYTVGKRLLGWGAVPSLFLGAAICDSATTLLAKTIDDMKWTKRPFVKYVISTSVLEDFLCVGVIALVTGVAKGNGISFGAVAMSLGSLAVFFVCTVVLGFVLLPRLLDAAGKGGDRETLLLTLLGCCFFVSWIAYKLDFSLALGAFLVGIIGSSSRVRSQLHELAAPLRGMFAAVFFVSIGCLVDPATCLRNAGTILLLSFVVVACKSFNCFAVSMLAGQSLKTSVQTALSLAQIGEFAYMIALLYMTLTGDAKSGMFQIVVGVSLLTTCLNPFLLRISDPAGDWLENNLPLKAKRGIAQYNIWISRIRAAAAPNEITSRMRKSVLLLAVYWVLVFAFAVIAEMLSDFDWSKFSVFFDKHKTAFFSLAANIAFLALLKPIWTAGCHLGDDAGTHLLSSALNFGGGKWASAIRHAARSFTLLVVSAVTLAEILMLNVNLMPEETSVRIGIAIAVAVALPFALRYIWPAVSAAGGHFAAALEAETQMAAEAGEVRLGTSGGRYLKAVLKRRSPAIGLSIKSLDIRAKTGASVVVVTREGVRTENPSVDWVFAAEDIVEAIGSAEQLATFKALLGIEDETEKRK